jgi:hypothetical protein
MSEYKCKACGFERNLLIHKECPNCAVDAFFRGGKCNTMKYRTRQSPENTPDSLRTNLDAEATWKLDVGAECNRLLEFADELDAPLNADRHQIRDDIRSIVARVAHFEELETE